MPATTPGRNLPYPLGTDRLMDGDDQIRKLAQSVENMVQTTRLTIPIVAANAAVNVTWTFPIAYSAAPTVTATIIGGVVSNGGAVSIGAVAANNAVVTGIRATGTAVFDVFVIAVGPVTAVA